MTDEHFGVLLSTSEAKKDKEGWFNLPEGRHLTLHAAFNGAGLSIARISSLRRDGELVKARTVKGETFVLALGDLYAGAVEAPASGARKAGFV